jgi:hypothetical protein
VLKGRPCHRHAARHPRTQLARVVRETVLPALADAVSA